MVKRTIARGLNNPRAGRQIALLVAFAIMLAMCCPGRTLADGSTYKQGYREGYHDGFTDAWRAGYQEGHKDGYQQAIGEGQKK